jgi:hypothetical protein
MLYRTSIFWGLDSCQCIHLNSFRDTLGEVRVPIRNNVTRSNGTILYALVVVGKHDDARPIHYLFVNWRWLTNDSTIKPLKQVIVMSRDWRVERELRAMRHALIRTQNLQEANKKAQRFLNRYEKKVGVRKYGQKK